MNFNTVFKFVDILGMYSVLDFSQSLLQRFKLVRVPRIWNETLLIRKNDFWLYLWNLKSNTVILSSYLSPSDNCLIWSINDVKADIKLRTLGLSTLYSPWLLLLLTMSYASSWHPSRIMFGNEMVGRISGANYKK